MKDKVRRRSDVADGCPPLERWIDVDSERKRLSGKVLDVLCRLEQMDMEA